MRPNDRGKHCMECNYPFCRFEIHSPVPTLSHCARGYWKKTSYGMNVHTTGHCRISLSLKTISNALACVRAHCSIYPMAIPFCNISIEPEICEIGIRLGRAWFSSVLVLIKCMITPSIEVTTAHSTIAFSSDAIRRSRSLRMHRARGGLHSTRMSFCCRFK